MAGGGGGSGGAPMLAGLIGNLTGKGGWQGMADPMGLLMKEPPPTPPFLEQQQALPSMATPQTTDRLAFLRSFGLQG